ncbi:MAG: hypothetical protein KDC35_12170 [Acidobacteria bacterium]|nr:hypothetical protein [Acidobacteriota bacterium]
MIEKTHHGVIAFTKACFDYSQIYPAENPSVIRQFQFLLSGCQSLIERDGGLTLEVNAHFLMVNGQYVEPKHLNKAVIDWFVGHCMERKIAEVSMTAGLNKRELEAFVQLFKTDPLLFNDESVASRILVPAGVEHIQINASRLDNSFNAARPLAEQKTPELPVVEPQHTSNMFEPDLFISQDSGSTLRARVNEQLQQKEVWKVVDFMANMRKHFHSKSPDVQRLALSRYRIVLEAVVERDLDEVVHSVFKTIPQDMEVLLDDASFNLHLNSLCLLLDRYLTQRFYPGIVFGFYTLASFAAQRPNTESEDRLRERLTPELMAELFKAKNTDTRLDRNIKVLFTERPTIICRTLIHHLGESEDKQERRTVLNVLSAMGSSIHDELVSSLRSAMNNQAPWYLQRNLLFVLAASPPESMTTTLKQLLEQPMHEKVADQAHRCLFALSDPELVDQGVKLIDQASNATLSTFLHIIGNAQNSAYAESLIDLAERQSDDRMALQVMTALAKTGSGHALTYLTGILQETSLLAKFKSGSRRLSAAQALSTSGHRTLMAALTRFKNDKDARVAALAQQMQT